MITDDRRAALLTARTINAVDFVEVDPLDDTVLYVHFVLNLPDAPTDPVPGGGGGLTAANFRIEGGERLTSVAVTAAERSADDTMKVTVAPTGDFAAYTLVLLDPAAPAADPPAVPTGFDPVSASAGYIFHIDCVRDFDCAAVPVYPVAAETPPLIDYLAKDYPGFVRVMLDRMALLAPRWQERNPADLGVSVVETLAYVADHLSYRQDVIATEAYLGTARLRTSVRRHARLVDYRIGEGSNARAWLRLRLASTAADGLVLPAGTRCATAYPGAGTALTHDTVTYQQAIDASAVFFETMTASAPLSPALGEMPLYAWSDTRACLPAGTTRATLAGGFPQLAPGMVLVLAEAKGPQTGAAADADLDRRQAVRLTRVTVGTDPMDGSAVTGIEWDADDALTCGLVVSSVTDAAHGEQPITGVAVAWGNIVLADHGRHVGVPSDPLVTAAGSIGAVPANGRFRPVLGEIGLTFAIGAPDPAAAASAGRAEIAGPVVPIVQLHSVDIDGNGTDWQVTTDLLDSGLGPDSPVFLPEIETDGHAYLLFGDGTSGRRPEADTSFTATYRVGIGTAGNVARDAVALLDPFGVPPGVIGVTNPMPAWGGVDPESIDSVRQRAPVMFRTQQRAVTAADYQMRAASYPGVQRAAATLRWTGSWHTVMLTIERERQQDLDDSFVAGLEAYLDEYRMAGMDVEVEEGVRVPLHVAMTVCVAAGYVATDVEQTLLEIFTAQQQPDGAPGLFSPDRLDLGQPFYLSPLIAAAQAVDGVQSVVVTEFERQDKPSPDGLAAGVLAPQRLEFFVLDSDPNYPERGRFELSVGGGL